MKKLRIYFAFVLASVFFIGCSKNVVNDIPNDDRFAILLSGSGTGSKYWKLDKLYINEKEQALTDVQKFYFKVYTADPANAIPGNPNIGTFKNQEGELGSWELNTNGGDFLTETFIDVSGVYLKSTYLINSISTTTLDIEKTVNYKTTREVYKGN